MDQAGMMSLLNNIALLLVTSVASETMDLLPIRLRRWQPWVHGVLLSIICLVLMNVPFMLQPGLFYDTRSVLISVTALVFGPIPAALTAATAMLFRLSIGGIGTVMGIGVVVTSAAIGLIWRRWVLPKTQSWRWGSIFLMGVVVHVAMLACGLLLPLPDFLDVLSKIAFPVLVVYPAGSFLLSMLLIRQKEYKEVRNRLEQSEEQYRRLYETMSLGVVYQGKDGRILSANHTAERILGRTTEQMRGRTSMSDTWETLFEDGTKATGNDHPAMIALATGKPCGPRVLGIYNPEIEDHVWISIHAVPLYAPGESEPYQVYTTFQDITAEYKANRNYYLLFHEMVDAYALHEMLYDADGKPTDYRFLAVNSAFERMTGLRAEDILGKTVLEVLPGTEPYWIETYGRVAKTGEPIQFENYTATTNKHFQVSAYQPAPNQFACTFIDVTTRVNAENESKRMMLRLRALLGNSPSPIMILDEEGKIVVVSASAERLLGSFERTEGAPGQAASLLAVIAERIRQLTASAPEDDPVIKHLDVLEAEGEAWYFESSLFPIHTLDQDKRLFGYLALDVTERIAMEQALKDSEERYSDYIRYSPYGVLVANEKGQYVDVNPAATAITGYDRERLLRMSILDITAGDSRADAIERFRQLQQTGSMSTELQYLHADGSVRWWTVSAAKITDTLFLSFSVDITERKKAEAELIYLSRCDFLTGLYNRRHFDLELRRLDSEANLPLSVIMGDINGVKLVNDAYGHAEGDRLIADSAAAWNGCCREGDVLARTGGDEFAMLLPKTDGPAAMQMLARIQFALAAADEAAQNERFHFSVSLGLGTKINANENIVRTMQAAEEDMNRRKLLEQNSSHSAILASIKTTMFERSHETEEHAERLVALSRLVADGLHLDQGDRDRLELLATLHDIGKVAINDQILTKPGKLTEEEWVEMRRHPEIGYRIAMSTPELATVAEGILCHQERWDGKGYPRALKGEEIPLLARIIAVADAFDAMTQDRPYRRAMSDEQAIAEIERNAGTQFDPAIARVFLEKLSEFRQKGRP